MAKETRKMLWKAVDGSIYTVDEVYVGTTHQGVRLAFCKGIAFNVGDANARHIVKLHNKSLGEEVC